jgi:CRISPR/Cas system CMR-associated protein Cmr3 (group 5 of RAMP superfamily)
MIYDKKSDDIEKIKITTLLYVNGINTFKEYKGLIEFSPNINLMMKKLHDISISSDDEKVKSEIQLLIAEDSFKIFSIFLVCLMFSYHGYSTLSELYNQ